MRFFADLHIHSKYARATSKECVPEYLDKWARIKGLDVIGTGDLTHPVWRQELKEKLIPAEEGLYRLKDAFRLDGPVPGHPRFLLSGEISSIYKKNGKVRKVHNVVLLPSLEAADALSKRLEAIGNIHSDGRPILGLDSRDLLEIVLEAEEKAIFIPAHIWTPHFSLFGAYSGFDTIEECFEDLTPYIHALETGLSSDPPMNWRLSALDKYLLVSNSDAHSPANLAREANIFQTELSYPAMYQALQNKDSDAFAGTLEFFPEEGKYHYDGHRNCKVCLKPSQTLRAEGVCPVCGGRITVGVLHRVEALADRPEGFQPQNAKTFESLVPLPEVIGSAMGVSSASVKVKAQYEAMLRALGSELFILREAPLEEIRQTAGPYVAEGIRKLRARSVEAIPGYDGEYGKIQVLNQQDRDRIAGQLKLFADIPAAPAVKRTPPQPKIPVPEETKVPEVSGEVLHYGLNAAQWAAASAAEPAVTVLAGPGTGKTRTLVYRIAYLIDELKVPPSQITAVTFTNKAAREMRERLEAHFQDKQKVRAMHIGTFHALCLKQLGDVTILDEAGALDLAAQVVETLGLSLSPKKFVQCVSMLKNGAGAPELPQGAADLYNHKLREAGVLDFDDILLEALTLEQSCRYLLVDEFQDINDLQYRLIRKWSQDSESIFVIGDPDQSIYGFRGADAQCFNRFQEDFAPVRQVRLTENYRSTPEIVGCALQVIHNPETRLEARRPAGETVRLVAAHDAFSEGIFIAKEINRLVGGIHMLDAHSRSRKKKEKQVRGFSDIAILYRTNRQAELLEECLQKEGIPYNVAGRADFLLEPQVRQALACFRQNPQKGKPSKLLGDYMQQNGLLEDVAMQRLFNMAILHKDMRGFLQTLTLGQEADLVRSGGKTYTPDAVSLLTLHGAKGLEFPVVFLCGVKEGLIPYQGYAKAGDLEEERRLFYVGLTRAQEELLLLTGPDPSPFLFDIPETLLEKENAHAPRRAAGTQLSLFE